MEFDLEVTFSGLNFFLVRPDGRTATVFQPDCRVGAGMEHVDRDEGKPHVGYLQFLLTNVPGFDPHSMLVERHEGVYRFHRETLTWDIPASDEDPPITVDGPPALECIAANADGTQALVPRPDLSEEGPSGVVMKTVLTSGKVRTARGMRWKFDRVLGDATTECSGIFASRVIWYRKVKAPHLKLTLTPFESGDARQITLEPREGVLRLKIANLCSNDVLEWVTDFGLPDSPERDEDFKWLYRLVKPAGGTWEELLQERKLPVPTRRSGGGMGLESCIGMKAGG